MPRPLQSAKGCNNDSAVFGLDRIASDNHIRSLLDRIPPSELSPLYQAILDQGLSFILVCKSK